MYFSIQETKKSEPDTAPGHSQYHQIAIALPEEKTVRFTPAMYHIQRVLLSQY